MHPDLVESDLVAARCKTRYVRELFVWHRTMPGRQGSTCRWEGFMPSSPSRSATRKACRKSKSRSRRRLSPLPLLGCLPSAPAAVAAAEALLVAATRTRNQQGWGPSSPPWLPVLLVLLLGSGSMCSTTLPAQARGLELMCILRGDWRRHLGVISVA